MSTSIEWARNPDGTKGETWNPTTGCDRVSPGCKKCYAATLAARLKAMGQAKYQNDGDPVTSGPGFALTVHPDTLDQPLRWKKPRTVFVNSMSDLFHQDVPVSFIEQVFGVMQACHCHTFQVLTKRPQRMREIVGHPGLDDDGNDSFEQRVDDACAEWSHYSPPTVHPDGALGWPLRNVWLGTSIESDRYTFRADHLRATPAAVRFLSCEPLLGPLPSLNLDGIDWVIVGGESGPGARPMHPDWVRDIRDRCADAGVAFFFKQWGEWAPLTATEPPCVMGDRYQLLPSDNGRAVYVERVGKKAAGRLLDGRTWDEIPGPVR